MAEEDSKDSEEGVAEGGKPWLALSLMLLVVPVVTLAITEFVVIPRLQVSMGGGTAAAKQDKAAGGKEASGGSKAGAELGDTGTTYAFDEMVANLSGTMGTRFIKVSFEVKGENADLAQILRVNKAIVLDAVISTLSSQSIQSLEAPGGRNRLRASLIDSLNQSLNLDLIDELYFTEFIIQ